MPAATHGIHRRVNDPRKGERPEYKVYRSRRSPLDRLRRDDGLDALRERGRPGDDARDDGPRRPGDGRPPRTGRPPRDPERRGRKPITPGRVLKWVALAIAGWLALSLVLFMVSAQLEQGVSDEAEQALAGGGNFLTGTTILVLGSDQRKGESIDETLSGPGRADSIMLVHVGLGSVRKLSIPRDSQADIPDHGTTKINAAYAFGGPALMIDTVERFLGNGLEIDHLIEVDFEDFPKFVDALGGITVDNRTRICAPEFDNFYRGFRLRRGERHLDGRRALGFARVRDNPCNPAENDLARAERQQEVLSGIRGQLTSIGTFFRLPWVSWRAPQTIRTDLRGPGLMLLAADVATGGAGETRVLEPSCLGCGVDASLVVTDDEKAAATRELLGKD